MLPILYLSTMPLGHPAPPTLAKCNYHSLHQHPATTSTTSCFTMTLSTMTRALPLLGEGSTHPALGMLCFLTKFSATATSNPKFLLLAITLVTLQSNSEVIFTLSPQLAQPGLVVLPTSNPAATSTAWLSLYCLPLLCQPTWLDPHWGVLGTLPHGLLSLSTADSVLLMQC